MGVTNGGGGLRSGSVKANCGKIAGKLQKTCGGTPPHASRGEGPGCARAQGAPSAVGCGTEYDESLGCHSMTGVDWGGLGISAGGWTGDGGWQWVPAAVLGRSHGTKR